jgi:tetratricopeptide (TPR) repeat protein
VADSFNHAVALLHSFEYDQAEQAFADIARQDPGCAMARWGEAMAYFHGLWGEYNAQKGAAAAAEARRLATARGHVTPRERAYIYAISEIFSDEAIRASRRPGNEPNVQGYSEPTWPPQVRYTERMAALHRAYPDDHEGTIFYAVALDTTAAPDDAAQANRHECVSLLNPLFVKLPNHPGIAHYIIHCTDSPQMAREGLDAARKYAAIAPASAHATHMPSHIFARLGLWDEMIASNRRSMTVALEHEHATVCMKADEALHAMHYLSFALVQTARLAESQEILQQAAAVPGIKECDSEMAIIPAAYVMETGDWPRAASIPTDAKIRADVERLIWEAIGVSAARSGDTARARTAEAKLAALRDRQAGMTGGPKNSAEAARLTVAAWIAHEAGQREQGVSTVREAVDLEQKLGTATAVFKPTRELLADMLLLDGKPQAALAEYRAVLESLPNRFNALYGAASAAYASGDKDLARRYDTDLTAIAHGDERPELETARKRLERTPD